MHHVVATHTQTRKQVMTLCSWKYNEDTFLGSPKTQLENAFIHEENWKIENLFQNNISTLASDLHSTPPTKKHHAERNLLKYVDKAK